MFVGSEDAKVIIQGIAITGITDISFSSNVEEKAVVLLADRGINRKVNNGHTVQCKISKSYLGKDRLQEFTGITNLSGQFIYGTNALDFDQATISSYSISADAESSPKVSVDIKIFGDFKPATSIQAGTADYGFENLGPESTFIDVEGRNSLLTNFSYGVDFDVKPTYEISSTKASTSRIQSPIKYSTSADMLMDEQEFVDLTGLMESETFNRSITFNMQNESSTVLNTYNIPNASISSQSASVTAGDLVKMSVKYQGLELNV
tara:strand:- start:5143 stop:5931 length:789 start_codon:yes stop_codon:yes gene_type:complete